MRDSMDSHVRLASAATSLRVRSSLADELSFYYVFGVADWDACAASAMAMASWALGNAASASEIDTDLKAIQFVAEWLEGHRRDGPHRPLGRDRAAPG